MSISRPNENKFHSLQDLHIIYEFRFDPIKEYLDHSQEDITKFQLIRNSIAHNNGILNDPKQADIEYFQKADGIKLSQGKNEIIIESDQFMITVINKLVNFLIKTIGEIINQKKAPYQ